MTTNSTKYLDITSSYRDRNSYLSPADFVVEISQTGQKSREQALDPVSDASPTLLWNNSFLEDEVANATDTGTATATISVDTSFSPTGSTILKIVLSGDEFRDVDDFYVGALLDITVGGVANVSRRIVSYKRLNATNAIIEVDSSFPSGAFGADGVIENPTPLPTNTANSVIQFFIPSGENVDNFYIGRTIQSYGPGATAETRTITAYNGITHLATLSSATTDDWSADATANTNFVIRKEPVCASGTLLGVSTDGKSMQLATTSASEMNIYNGGFVRIIEPVPTIVSGLTTTVAPYGEERRIISYVADAGSFAAAQLAGDSAFTLDSGASSTNNFYVGSFLTHVGGNTREVLTYDGTTKTGTISGTWGGAITLGDTWVVRSVHLESAFSTDPVVGGADEYEIECFTRDNAVPFSYNGSLVSSQEEVCYDIELLNLILPNSTLATGRGGRIAFYPYVYVVLEGIAGPSGAHNGVIYSNNPNSYTAMFKAVVDDTPTPLISPFIKIDGDGMVQTVKFKPNDSFRLKVLMPNGTIFTTVASDTTSPAEPNPLVQISALFSLRRQ